MKMLTHKTLSLAIALGAGMLSPVALAQADETQMETSSSSWQARGQNLVRSVGQWFGLGAAAEVAVESAPAVTRLAELPTSRGFDRSFDRVAERNVVEVSLSPELMLEAFPALTAMDDTLRLLDVSHAHTILDSSLGYGANTQGVDLSASYVWESARFGQFIVSTNTTYVYNPLLSDGNLESVNILSMADTVNFGAVPELQSSLTFTWQIGNHSATAVTSYSETMDQFAKLNADRLSIDQLNDLVGQMTTLDLRYGYNVKTGRQGNASFSVGVRNLLDRRQFSPMAEVSGRLHEPTGRVAYGTIKYQF
jgi:hypothetical protein